MDFVVIKHTLFALPFAYLGALVAKKGIPELNALFWIGMAFFGARSGAMALNNLIDKNIDANNPRTRMRELPCGKISTKEVWGIIIFSYALLFYSASKLNPLCLKLSPIVVLTSLIYPYLKRFTPITHYVLGLNLAYAPAGGWLAITGSFEFLGNSELAILSLMFAVIFWVAGFDIIYSIQDVEFDKKHMLYSIPSIFGIKKALSMSFVSHIMMLIFLVAFAFLLRFGIIFYIGLGVILALILYEHSLLKHVNIQKAFFEVNVMISLSMFVFTLLEIML